MDVIVGILVVVFGIAAALANARTRRGGRSIPARPAAARPRAAGSAAVRPPRPKAPRATVAPAATVADADSRGTIARDAARAQARDVPDPDFAAPTFDEPVAAGTAARTPARRPLLEAFRTPNGLLGAIVASEVLAPPAAFGSRSVADPRE